jgi:hypothetical protein
VYKKENRFIQGQTILNGAVFVLSYPSIRHNTYERENKEGEERENKKATPCWLYLEY